MAVAAGWESHAEILAVTSEDGWLWYWETDAEPLVYSPMLHPEVASTFAACNSDADILAFVETHGALGWAARARLTPAADSGVWTDYQRRLDAQARLGPALFGEPLAWARAHAQTARWCLETVAYLRTRKGQPIKPLIWGLGPMLGGKVPAAWRELSQPLHAEDFDGERLAGILMENVVLTAETIIWDEDALHRRRTVETLVEAIYVHLGDAAVGGQVPVTCARPGCGRRFLQVHGKQRYCPHPAGREHESRCAGRMRARKHRAG